MNRHVNHLRPAFLGDELALLTWVADLKRQSSTRRYLFHRPADDQVVARAETNWVFIRLADGRPQPIVDDLRASFELVPEGEDVLASAGLRPPKPA